MKIHAYQLCKEQASLDQIQFVVPEILITIILFHKIPQHSDNNAVEITFM